MKTIKEIKEQFLIDNDLYDIDAMLGFVAAQSFNYGEKHGVDLAISTEWGDFPSELNSSSYLEKLMK